MSVVRYTDKKTGRVTLYESTSHYDPVTKQSRPIRKYLGVEDPKTGELIPSTGKPGRRKMAEQDKQTNEPKKEGPDYRLLYEEQKKECEEMRRRIKALESKNMLLANHLERMKDIIQRMQSIIDASTD